MPTVKIHANVSSDDAKLGITKPFFHGPVRRARVKNAKKAHFMKKYELLSILPAKYTDAELAELRKKIAGMATTAGATVTEQHDLGKRKLAYPINHVRNGNYVLYYFEAEPEAVNKLNTVLRLSTDLLRHLIVERDMNVKTLPAYAEEEEARRERPEEPARQAVAMAPVQAPAAKEKISMAEVEKKLDEILTEEVK